MAVAEVTQPPWRERLRTAFQHTGNALGLVWSSSRRGTLALLGLTVVAAVLSPASALLGKLIIDSVVAARESAHHAASDPGARTVMFYVLLELAAMTSLALTDRALALLRTLVGTRLGIDVNLRILRKAVSLELRHFEDPEFYDKLTRARKEASSRPLQMVSEHLGMLRAVVGLTGYLVLLVRFSGWMVAAVLLASVPAFISEARFSVRAYRLRNWRSPEARQHGYYEQVLSTDNNAKELKLFGLGPFFLERWKSMAEMFYAEDSRLALRRAGWGYAMSLLSLVTFYGCYVTIAVWTVTGRLSLGDMTLYLVAFRQASNSFQGLLGALGNMYEHNLYMSNLFDFLAIPTTAPEASAVPPSAPAPAPTSAPAPAPPAPRPTIVAADESGIRFDNLGFRYPDAERWALRNIDLFVPKGMRLALVGENGAGKTTLIKLLSRLYDPSEGRVLLDGRDLRDWDGDALRARIGVIFQDFNRYYLPLRENVGVGSVDHLGDELRIQRAIDQGGARELVAQLPAGLDTILGRRQKGGVELSGGQWQKVALARAFMREEADVLILDEPTSALDAEAEHAVFQRFQALARGRTTILISHRFSTVRMADRILVLEDGRILEDGSHAQLVEAGARYAHLFDLQARGYR